jgi:quercetin dioxygenase-like cupin family protein
MSTIVPDCALLWQSRIRQQAREETIMDIHPAAKVATRKASADWFTGTVWQDPIVDAAAPARVRSARVSFEPGARTNWHHHPLGQTLYVVSGTGRVQTWGGPVREIYAGDSIWIPPLEKHWHGATPTQGMVHIAIHESLDGTHVTWLEKVTDAEFNATPVAR